MSHYSIGRFTRCCAAVAIAVVPASFGYAAAAGASEPAAVASNPTGAGLVAVSRTSSAEGWAVGSRSHDDAPPWVTTLTQHWDGTQWSTVKSLDSAAYTNLLNDVASVSAGDAWAVGSQRPTIGETHSLVEHWDGVRWQLVRSPTPGSDQRLNSVAAVTANDVWAVGSKWETGGCDDVPIAEHWDGTTWTLVKLPRIQPSCLSLVDLTAFASDDVWAFGGGVSNIGGAYFLHWDGVRWKRADIAPLPGNALTSTDIVSATDIWAVGSTPLGHNRSRPASAHWDGISWQVIPGAKPPGAQSALRRVVALAPDDVWAVGNYIDGWPHTLTEHWDGSAWSYVPSPNKGYRDFLQDIDAVSPSDIMAVGAAPSAHPLAMHWDGSTWSLTD